MFPVCNYALHTWHLSRCRFPGISSTVSIQSQKKSRQEEAVVRETAEHFPAGHYDTTELFTNGSFYKKNNVYYVTYDESEATGFTDSKTTLKIDYTKLNEITKLSKILDSFTLEYKDDCVLANIVVKRSLASKFTQFKKA